MSFFGALYVPLSAGAAARLLDRADAHRSSKPRTSFKPKRVCPTPRRPRADHAAQNTHEGTKQYQLKKFVE